MAIASPPLTRAAIRAASFTHTLVEVEPGPPYVKRKEQRFTPICACHWRTPSRYVTNEEAQRAWLDHLLDAAELEAH